MNSDSCLLFDVPINKKIPNTNYTVDCFKMQPIDCTHYFLTHFHSDHYNGLTSSFTPKIYCSQTTANLLTKKIRIPVKNIVVLNLYEKYLLDNDDYVIPIDAHHCPGSICLVFDIKGNKILHTGDFRASKFFYEQDFLTFNFSLVFLDNTYESYRNFDPQEYLIKQIIEDIKIRLNPKGLLFPLKYKFVFPTYLIGKEKIFLSIAEYFDYGIYLNKNKNETIKCFCNSVKDKLNQEVRTIMQFCGKNVGTMNCFDRITTNICDNQIMVMSMTFLSQIKLNQLFKDVKADKIIIYCGTGWKDKTVFYTWKKSPGRVIKKGIELKYFPYSEHSSNEELLNFKKLMKYKKILNTVKNK
ncbi:hypothetical protein LUQ84_000974 [Hamiltosporidium tvaerminnensis]|nr:hypothetical protein LUQ84_000974 [Hamiltosporidium tvaerminnensis]